MSVLDAALAAAELGWPVFPTRDKKPLVESWKAQAAETPAGVFELPWGDADGYGIALPPDVIVVDLDADKATGSLDTAMATLQRLAPDLHAAALSADAGHSAPMPVVRTRSGGLHLYIQTDSTDAVRQTKPGPSVDLRVGGRGYVIGPGSPGYSWLTEPAGPAELPFPGEFGSSIVR